MKRLDFINKRLHEKNDARAYINNADEEMLEYYWVFAKKIKPLPPGPQLSEFYHPPETQEMMNYYLLQLAQALQHMPYTITLKKRQTKRNYPKHTISLIVFGPITRQSNFCIKLRLCQKNTSNHG